MTRKAGRALMAAACAAALVSCSTTRVLQENQYRLESNEIVIEGSTPLRASDVSPYIRQQANTYFLFGWSPFLNLYNLSTKDEGLWASFCHKVGTPPVVYNPDLVGSSRTNICDHLENLGYYGSEVRTEEIVTRKRVKVRYTVVPGRRFVIDEVHYDLPRDGSFASDFLSDTASVSVKPGDFLSEEALEKESVRSAASFREKGYYNFSSNNYFFEADTITTPGRLILNYAVRGYTRNESPESAVPLVKHTIGEVSISRPKSFPIRESVIRSLNTIHPGDLYRESEVNRTYGRLSALKVFNSVGVEMTPVDESTVNCNIRLTQSKTQGVKANFEASTNSSGLLGFSPQLSYYHKNIFHGGEWLNVSMMGNFQFKSDDPSVKSTEAGISAALSLPGFLGLKNSVFRGTNIPRTEFKAAYTYQNRPEFTRNVGSFSMGWSGSTLSNIYYQIYPLDVNYVHLFNLDPAFSKTLEKNPFMRYSYQDHLDAGLSATIYHTTNADIVPKTPYRYARLNVDVSGNVLSAFSSLMKTGDNGQRILLGAPYSQYVSAELNLGKTFRWGRDNGQQLATHILVGAGFAYGNSTALPFEKQFYVGGSSSLRGWQTRAVGPGFAVPDDSFSIPSQTGDSKFEVGVEYRARLFWKVEGALFVDAGNVWNLYEENDYLRSLAADWGLGIRVDLDFILLRLDCGFKMHDPSRPEGERWVNPRLWFSNDGFAIHFGVGYPF